LLAPIGEQYFAKECVGSNRLSKRTIATSRGDDNRVEKNREPFSARTTTIANDKAAYYPRAAITKKPEGKPLSG